MQENGEACHWWLGQGILIQSHLLFWTSSVQSDRLEGLSGGDPACETSQSPGLDWNLFLSSPSPLLNVMQCHCMMSSCKPLFSWQSCKGSTLSGLGKGEGLFSSHGQWALQLWRWLGGTDCAACYSSCQWLSAVAGEQAECCRQDRYFSLFILCQPAVITCGMPLKCLFYDTEKKPMTNVKVRFIDGKVYMIMIQIWRDVPQEETESDTSSNEVTNSHCD